MGFKRRPPMMDGPQLLEWIFSQCVADANGCLNWTRQKSKNGYALLTYLGKNSVKCSRVVLKLARGLDMSGKWFACHKCNNPACLNPEHLFTGTNAENMQDCKAKGRLNRAIGASAGNAKLDESKVRFIRGSTLSQRVLGKMFGLDHTAIHDVRTFKTWKHVLALILCTALCLSGGEPEQVVAEKPTPYESLKAGMEPLTVVGICGMDCYVEYTAPLLTLTYHRNGEWVALVFLDSKLISVTKGRTK